MKEEIKNNACFCSCLDISQVWVPDNEAHYVDSDQHVTEQKTVLRRTLEHASCCSSSNEVRSRGILLSLTRFIKYP